MSPAEALARIPEGVSTGLYDGRRYVIAKTVFNGGRSLKLVAEADGDYISLNLYRLASGDQLKPCEMPEARVLAFLRGLRPEPNARSGVASGPPVS